MAAAPATVPLVPPAAASTMPAPTPVAPAPVPAATAATTPVESRNVQARPAELEKFLINFVVEQTGYPPEVVELDADLEADLGIDSIKKAQLFGELAEYFDVQPSENDDARRFPDAAARAEFPASEPTQSADAADEPAAPAPPANGSSATMDTSGNSTNVCVVVTSFRQRTNCERRGIC